MIEVVPNAKLCEWRVPSMMYNKCTATDGICQIRHNTPECKALYREYIPMVVRLKNWLKARRTKNDKHD